MSKLHEEYLFTYYDKPDSTSLRMVASAFSVTLTTEVVGRHELYIVYLQIIVNLFIIF